RPAARRDTTVYRWSGWATGSLQRIVVASMARATATLAAAAGRSPCTETSTGAALAPLPARTTCRHRRDSRALAPLVASAIAAVGLCPTEQGVVPGPASDDVALGPVHGGIAGDRHGAAVLQRTYPPWAPRMRPAGRSGAGTGAGQSRQVLGGGTAGSGFVLGDA